MSHSPILKLAAVFSLVFGVALALAPNQLAALYNAPEMNPTGVYNSMLYGCALIALGVMYWAASTAPDVADARYVILAGLVFSVASFLVAITRQLTSEAATPAAWLNVVIFAVFALLFAYVYFGKLQSRQATGIGAH